jgi:hypothetical protein
VGHQQEMVEQELLIHILAQLYFMQVAAEAQLLQGLRAQAAQALVAMVQTYW